MTLGFHLVGLPKFSQSRLESVTHGQWPVMAAWGWQLTCSLSVLWCGEDIHRLGVQGAKVSTLHLHQAWLESQQGP
jgi:hypothetical protein